METKIKTIHIGKDGWPVEQFSNKGIRYSIINFLRRIIHTDHIECRECWRQRESKKSAFADGISSSPSK